MLSQIIAAQKVAIIGAKHLTATGDGVSILALENLTSGEVFYFTDNEYNNVTNQFNDVAESVVRITITSPIGKGNVIFFKEEDTPDTFTATVTSGSGSVTVVHEAFSGPFSIADFGESLYLYTDNDADPANGVTEIHSAFFPGSLVTSDSSGGPMPTAENPDTDFPDAIVVHNFPAQDYETSPYDDGVNRVEYNTSSGDRTDVNKVMLENSANYVMFGNNQDLSTTFFTNFNLVTSDPIVTLTTNFSELNENNASNFNFTFSLNNPATTNLVINFVVSGSATFNSDYTQSGATGMNTSAGTVTIANGASSATVVLNPTAETVLEPDETIQLTITAGTGYDAGSPSSQAVTIINDDTLTVVPDVTITGTRHYTDTEDGISEFSFVALKDLSSGASYMFSSSPFDKNTLLFSDVSTYPSELKWTVPSGGVARGDVIVVKKTAPDTFTVTKNGSTSATGTIIKLSPSKNFYISEFGGVLRAYTDSDDNPFNGITTIQSQIYTYQVSTGFGGNIPASLDLSTLYTGSVLVDGFPDASPGRLEYDPALRTTTVDQANFVNPANWLYAAPVQDLSPIPFNNIIISEGSSNPLASVVNATSSIVEGSGDNTVFTFSLNSEAVGDIAVNFNVSGSATYLTDYTVSGADVFSATAGSILIPDGATSAQLTITPADDNILETNDNVLLTIISGTGYDGGAPGDAFVTITDDDTNDAEPLVAILGINHLDPTELSIVALQNIDPNSTFFFVRGEFNTETLSFPPDVGIYKWISPNTCIPEGTVLSVSGPSSGPLTVNCNGTSGADCGDFTMITSGLSFDFLDIGTKYYVYQDSDEDPSNGITQIHSVIHTGGVYPTMHTGGNLPPEDNPKLKYSNAVVVDGFPNTAPDRTEFDATKRTIDVSTSGIEDLSNWLHGQDNAALSTTNFNVIAPEAFCALPFTVQLDVNGEASISVEDIDLGSTVSCGIATLTISQTDFDCSHVGDNTITLTVADSSGNSSSCTTVVTVEDNITPEALCVAPFTIQLDANGEASISADDINFNSTDNCDIDTTTINQTDFDCSHIGDNGITLTVTDSSGNSSSCTTVVTVEDNITPEALCVAPFTIQLDANGEASISADDINFGSADSCGMGTITINQTDFDCSHVGDNVITLTVADIGGNVSTCNTTVTVEDNIAPAAQCVAGLTIQLDANGEASISVADIDNSSFDNCGTDTMNLSQTDFDCSDIGENTVTLTVTDTNGNASTCTTTVTVEENIAPTVQCVAGFTLQLDANGEASISVADIDNSSFDYCGIDTMILSQTDFDCSDIGDNEITLTVTDNGGNTSTCTTIVTVEDNIAPTAQCVAGLTIRLDANGEASISVADINDSSFDNCGIDTMTLSQTDFDCSDIGDNVITLTITDIDGNASTCTTTVNVEDNIAPTAQCFAGLTIQLDANGEASISVADIDNSSFDNCGTDTMNLSQTDFDCSDIGENTVTLTVTDTNGNASTCTTTVTVEENIAPTVQCVAGFTLQLDANGEASISVADIDNSSFDYCGIDTMTLSQTDFDCSDIGDNEITLTVTDTGGNASTCTTTVTVEDNIGPIVSCIDFTLELGADGIAFLAPDDLGGTTNNCAISITEIDIEQFDCSDVGNPVLVTYFASDVSRNTASCTAMITVVDTLGPGFNQGTLPDDQTRMADENGGYSLEDFTVGVTAIDNCSDPLRPVVIGQDIEIGTVLTPGVYDITLNAIDDFGNNTDYIFELTVDEFIGTGDSTGMKTILLYPNPAETKLYVGNPQEIPLNNLFIYDMNGHLVRTFNLKGTESEENIDVDVSNLARAAYLISIQSETGSITKQLIKK